MFDPSVLPLHRLRRFGRDERGSSLIEYTMTAAVIGIFASGALAAVGSGVEAALQTVIDAWP